MYVAPALEKPSASSGGPKLRTAPTSPREASAEVTASSGLAWPIAGIGKIATFAFWGGVRATLTFKSYFPSPLTTLLCSSLHMYPALPGSHSQTAAHRIAQ